MEGRSFSRALKRKETFLYLGNCDEFEIYVKKRPCERAALSLGTLFGNLEGVRLPGLLKKKRKCVSGFLFLDPEGIKS
jgi:hypothetical protein